MRKDRIGLAVGTVWDALYSDFVGTHKKIAKIGYPALEFADFGPLSLEEYKHLADDLGIRLISRHVITGTLFTETQKFVDEALLLGQEYLIYPYMGKGDAEGYRGLSEAMGKASAICSAHGITFCHHNHATEFDRIDDRFVLDILLDPETGGSVKSELDVYWTTHAGEDPLKWIEKLAGRLPLVHMKDMASGPDREFCEVGYGIIDMPAIVKAGDKAGAQWYITEQDKCLRDPFESAKMSYETLVSLAE